MSVITGEAKILSYLNEIADCSDYTMKIINHPNDPDKYKNVHIQKYIGTYFVDKKNELYSTFCIDSNKISDINEEFIYFVIYEFVKGISLSDKMDEPPSVIFSINLLSQILYTLKRLHDNDIAHRDIKPANIIYDCDQKIFTLIDFGLSCTSDINISNSKCNSIAGTPAYVLPDLMLKNKEAG